MLNKDNDDEKAEDRLKEVIECIKTNDKDNMKAMFSEQALNDAKELDKGIDYLFTLIEEDIESWDRLGANVNEKNDYGDKVVESSYRYNVYTDNEQFIFTIVEYTRDDYHPENVGVYSLTVSNVKNEEPIFLDAGIYKPEE